MFHGLGGQFVQEPGRKCCLLLTAEGSDPATAEVKLALGPSDADKKQPSFLFQLPVVIVGTRVRKQSLLQRRTIKTTGNSRPLAACSVINVTLPVCWSQRSIGDASVTSARKSWIEAPG